MDRGVWQATVHGVTKSLTRSIHTHTHRKKFGGENKYHFGHVKFHIILLGWMNIHRQNNSSSEEV